MDKEEAPQHSQILRKERTEIFVGAFIFVGLIIMGTLVWQFGQFGDRFSDRYQVEIIFQDATGLIEGGDVRFGGAKIGYVAEAPALKEDFAGIRVPVEIFEQYDIPEGSEFAIDTSGLMGDRYISIEPPKERNGKFISRQGASVQGGSGDMIAEVTERAAVLSDKLEIVLTELDDAVSEFKNVASNLTSVTEKIDQQIMSEENLANISTAIEKLSVTTNNLAVGSAELQPLLQESQKTVVAARKPFESADEMIAKLDPAIASLEPAFAELEPTIVELRSAIEDIGGLIEAVETGDGVAGALISDSQLREDLESFIAKLEEYGILGYGKADKDEKGGFRLFGR